MILDTLGKKYGTDKAEGSHNYLFMYEFFLQRFRDKPIRLLEMGVGNGASLRMWREYFPLAVIVGFDIDPQRMENAGRRVDIHIGDQGNDEDLQRVQDAHGPFDVIVDDAGHDPRMQVSAYKWLLPKMPAGGIYILEDVGGGEAIEFLKQIMQNVLQNQCEYPIEMLAIKHETSVTVLKGGS